MSVFEGLAEDVVGVILLGAEGCAETEGAAWLRDATPEEKQLLAGYCRELTRKVRGEKAANAFSFADWLTDEMGRPYWVKAVLRHPDAPEIALEKVAAYTRSLRIHVNY